MFRTKVLFFAMLPAVFAAIIGCIPSGGRKPDDGRQAMPANTSAKDEPKVIVQKTYPPLPKQRQPPTGEQLQKMTAKLEKLDKPLPVPYAAPYTDDWQTQGDWYGRTFRHWAIMYAVVSPFDLPCVITDQHYDVHEFIGPNFLAKRDLVRRWIHWMQTDNPKVLWHPRFNIRRQAELDDHGEVYPLTLDGPDLWLLLEIKHPGVFKIGMYFFNKDGHSGMNRYRDYLIEFYPSPRPWKYPADYPADPFYATPYSKEAEEQTRKMPPLAKSRVRDFWGGVHKNFVVTGPANYYVKIDRNYSYNTILSAVSIDRLYGEPTDVEQYGLPFFRTEAYIPPAFPVSYERREPRQTALLWQTLDKSFAKAGNIEMQQKYRVAAYIAASADAESGESEKQLAYAIKWRLNQWDEKQRKEWKEAMQAEWQWLYDSNENLRKAIEGHKKGFNKELQYKNRGIDVD